MPRRLASVLVSFFVVTIVTSVVLITASPVAAQATFSDQTAAAGISHDPQMGAGTAGALHYPGAAAADFNNDGWPDLYLLGGGGVADKLYINQQDGTFVNEAAAWGVDTPHRGKGIAVGDFNKDGWLDAYITSGGTMDGDDRSGQHILYKNNGNGTFTNIAVSAGVDTTSATWLVTTGPAFGDYDRDGDLDLFVPTWVSPIDPNDGNRLFRNNGDETFTDVTVAAGIIQTNMHGFCARFADMDKDGWPELLITSDFGTSKYYVNNGDGTFTNQTGPSGTGQDSNGMGHTVADIDGDGMLDWYVTSIFSDSVIDPQDGNHLYINQGNHVYTDLTNFGAEDGGVGWGTEALDCDHDMDLDLAETNGSPFGAEYLNEPSYLYRNNGDGTFTDIHVAAGIDNTYDGKTLITLDYNRDGRLDILITSYNDPVQLWRSDLTGTDINWLEIVLDSSMDPALPPNGIGTWITATTGAVSQVRYMDGGPSYIGQSEYLIHFGLAGNTTVDTLSVEWVNGAVTVLNDVAANQRITVEAPAAGSGAPGEASKPSDQLLAAYNSGTGFVDATYTPACDATDHTVYHGDIDSLPGYGGAVCGIGTSGNVSFDPGSGATFFVIVGNDGAVEGPYGETLIGGTPGPRPEDTGTLGCDIPQDLGGTCDLP